MVRETRHLWVGNLPDNVSKERIQEYFNRYGPVQSVKPLQGRDGTSPTSVTVAFMDIKSACKARQTEHKIDERLLKTDFYDPASGQAGGGSCPPGVVSCPPGGGSCPPHPEEKGGGPGGGVTKLEHRSSHPYYRGPAPPQDKYDGGREFRGGGGGGGGSVGGGGQRYSDDYRPRSRPQYRNGPFNQDVRNGGSVGLGSYNRNNYSWKDRSGVTRTDQYNSEKERGKTVNGHSGPLDILPSSLTPTHPQHRTKKKRRKSRSSDSGSDSSGSDSVSRSSSSSSSRSSSSGSNSSRSRSRSRASVASKMKSSLGNYLPHTEWDKLCTIIVRNLPSRIDDEKLRDELRHEYKRGGCAVRGVRIVTKTNSSAGRVAIITFEDPADVSKALEDSRNKRIFGSLIEADKLNNHPDDRPRDVDLSEYHPKATRTLFVGNISREVVPSEIHDRFKEFGEILEIDIKKPDYALVQFVDIRSVVRAIRGVDRELIAGQRVRLAFGLSVATKCVWCDGVGVEATEKMLQQEFSQFGKIQDLIIDRSRGHALVYFDQLKKATIAVREMRGRNICGSRLQTDYASHECRAAFFDHCKKSGMDIRERAKPWEQEEIGGSTDRRELDKSDRLGRERSIDSRGSSIPRSSSRRDDRNPKKGRDEYDEELRRFQSERGNFDDSNRCFTPPHRRAPPPPPLSRSPSPPTRLGRSPGAQSRSSGYENRTDGVRTFSDRDSVVSDGSRQGSPSRDSYRSGRYKPRTQAISPPGGESRHGSPADMDEYERRRRYRTMEDSSDFRNSRIGSGDRSRDRPVDPRVGDLQEEKKGEYKLAGVDSGLSEDTSSGSSGSVPDVDNAKLFTRVSVPPRRISTDSAVSRSSHHGPDSRPPSPLSHSIPVYTGGSSLLRIMSGTPQEAEQELGFGAPRTPSSPPPDSDGSRPGTPLCDENPENLMTRPASGPVRLASHLRTSSTSEPMSLPLPMFAQDVLSTSPGDRRSSTERQHRPPTQISPREPPSLALLTKPGRPDLAKLSIISPTKFGAGSGTPDPRTIRDPRLKSPSLKSPSLKSPCIPTTGGASGSPTMAGGHSAGFIKSKISPSVPAGPKTQTTLSLACSSPDETMSDPFSSAKLDDLSPSPLTSYKPKDPRLATGLLTVAVHSSTAATSSPSSPSPKSSGRQRALSINTQETLVSQDNKPKKEMELEERLKLLDEQYEKWSGLTRIPSGGSSRAEGAARFNLDMRPAQPSPIVQKLLARKSVFDEDSKRLENLSEKYDPNASDDKSESQSVESQSSPATPGYTPTYNFPQPNYQGNNVLFSPDDSVSPVGSHSSRAFSSPSGPTVSREVVPSTTIPAVISTVSNSAPLLRVATAVTKAPLSPISTKASTPQSPAPPVSPRGGLSNRVYYSMSAQSPKVPSETSTTTSRQSSEFTSNKQLVTRPLPLPNKAGTPATSATVPIKPLVDKLGKPTAFTKPSATVTPTLKSTGIPASTVRPTLSSTSTTKTVSTCTMLTSAKPPLTSTVLIPSVEKGEASSTTCSPKLDSVLSTTPGADVITSVQETDSDPNVTSTTKDPSQEAKKKLDSLSTKDPMKTIRKELDSLTSLKEKKEIKEELFAPTMIQTLKPKVDQLKKSDIDSFRKDKKSNESYSSSHSKDRLKSSKETQKHKQKLKQKNDLKDFLTATATIRKEASKRKEKKPSTKEEDIKKWEEKSGTDHKRRLSSNSEVEDAELKSKATKIPKLESDCEPEHKKLKLSTNISVESSSSSKLPLGRIPKLEKPRVENKDEITKKDETKKDGKELKDLKRHSHSSSSRSKSKQEPERHRHKSEKKEDRDKEREKEKDKEREVKEKENEKEKHKKKKSSRREEDKSHKYEKSKSRSISTDDEKSKREKEQKKHKDPKKRDEKERRDVDKERRDKEHRVKEHKEKNRDKDKDREKDRDKEKDKDRDKDRERDRDKERMKERKRKKEEERKRTEQARKKKKLENDSSSEEEGGNSSGEEPKKFSIFDEPTFDINNPIYFSMYDKVKARRSCVKAREEEEARKQQEALEKFSKLKAQRARKETKKKSLDSSDDSLSDATLMKNIYSEVDAEDDGPSLKKKPSMSMILSSDENNLEGDEDDDVSQKEIKKRIKSHSSSSDKKPVFKSKKVVVDTSDDSDLESISRSKSKNLNYHRSKLSMNIYSSDDDHQLELLKSTKHKSNIYTESDSEPEKSTGSKTKIGSEGQKMKLSHMSDSESEPNEPKASALAVLAKSKRKTPTKIDSNDGGGKKSMKNSIKLEPPSSDSDTHCSKAIPEILEKVEIKKEIKTEGKDENARSRLDCDKSSKKKSIKKDKKKDKLSREKDKSILGQKMAKIFGTSSEDESMGRNSKPPTPNTSSNKPITPNSKPLLPKMTSDQMFSASDSDKAPALMTDSDDDVPSRPPTPTFQSKRPEELKQPVIILPSEITAPVPEVSKAVSEVKTTEKRDQLEKTSRNLFDSSDDEDEILPVNSRDKTKKELDRSRRLSAHERQKECENLFDSLLTVNVDLPSKSTSRKSPGGTLKSPGSLKSPGQKITKGMESQKSPGSHRSPLLSPGGKPTYLLAHTFDKAANREAEKRHKEQEREMLRLKTLTEKDTITKPSEGELKTKEECGDTKPLLSIGAEIDSHKPENDFKHKTYSESISHGSQEISRLIDEVGNLKKKDYSEIHLSTAKISTFVPKENLDNSKLVDKENTPMEIGMEKKSKESEKAVNSAGASMPKETVDKQNLKDSSLLKETTDSKPIVTNDLLDTSEIKILEEKITTKPKIMEVLKPVDNVTPLSKEESEFRMHSNEKVSESSASSYAAFAEGSLDAASSPSPGSDYDEDRLVIRDGDDSSDVEMHSEPLKSDVIDEQGDSSEICVLTEIKCKQLEPSREEQLEKSIASITSELATKETSQNMETTTDPVKDEVPALDTAKEPVPEVEPPIKRTVISQEETESAVNALLGESFDSFDPEEPSVTSAVENVEEESASFPVDDEAAAAVAGIATEMSPEESITTELIPNTSWQQSSNNTKSESEDIENAAARPDASEKLMEVVPPDINNGTESVVIKAEIAPAEAVAEKTDVVTISEAVTVTSDPPVEEAAPRGRGRGRGVSRGRGRGSASVKALASQPTQRGRGRGAVRLTRGQINYEEVDHVFEELPPTVSDKNDHPEVQPGTTRGRGRGRGSRGGFKGKLVSTEVVTNQEKPHDVFEFQESDDDIIKSRDSVKPTSSISSQQQAEEPSVSKKDELMESSENLVRPPTLRGRGRGGKVSQTTNSTTTKSTVVPTSTLTSVTVTTTPSQLSVNTCSPPAQSLPSPSVSCAPLKVSTEEKLSPMASPGSAKSPRQRVRRSTDGKSKESEEESVDTNNKIKLILEKAKQEAEQSASLNIVQQVSTVPVMGPMAATFISSAPNQELSTEQKLVNSTRPIMSSGQTVTLVATTAPIPFSTNMMEPRSSVLTVTPARTGIPQPTVLPPRHDQQVRPAPGLVTTPSRAPNLVTGPRHPLPIQLPTQPLPPDSVRKTQPVLLEQNQPLNKLTQVNCLPRTTLPVSLPTEPIPRSVALPPGTTVTIPSSSVVAAPSLPRSPLPIVTSHIATPRSTVPLTLISSQVSTVRHSGPVNTRPAPQVPRTLHSSEGQRVSLKQRDGCKEGEPVDMKTREQMAIDALVSTHQQPLKREYLQPRERETVRATGTPMTPVPETSRPKEEDKTIYPPHQQQYDPQTLDFIKMQELRNYRELTILYQQLLSAGHTETMAIQLAQSVIRERYMEESRPGSVPPLSHMHHMEEIRRQQQQTTRQPMPAHSGDHYRQTESPIYHLPPAHSGSQHPYMQRDPVGPPAAHMEPYRREDLVPPAAHSSQLQRLTHSPAISDFSTSRPQSPSSYQPQPLYTSSSSEPMEIPNYRLPYLAAYPICWSGILALKNDMASVRMHYVSGCRDLAKASLPNSGATLKIVQRMRLEDTQIDGVKRKMDTKSEHCVLLALPNGSEQEEIEKQSKILRNNFITYLQLKSAAGIVNVSNEDNQPAYIVHVFPSCDFANENLARIAPNLLHRVADIEHLVIVIATVFNDANK